MQIFKRSGQQEAYEPQKIIVAISKAFEAVGDRLTQEHGEELVAQVEAHFDPNRPLSVEVIQDAVELVLMQAGHYQAAKDYILYREIRRQKRSVRQEIAAYFPEYDDLPKVLLNIERDFKEDHYNLLQLLHKFQSFYKQDCPPDERLSLLIKAAIELTDKDATRWEFIAGRLLALQFHARLGRAEAEAGIQGFVEKIQYLTDSGFYAPEILQTYSREELTKAAGFIDPSRDDLLNYSGFDLLARRYVITNHQHVVLESIQELFLGIALFLAIPERTEIRLEWVQRFYDMLSQLQVTMATPTLSNSRKPFHQLSSCFIDTVPDDLQGIYRSISNFANVSKFGGGMGLYFGKVRAQGSDIRGFEGAAGGIIRWIRLANDTAVAVDQLGMRQGAVACYLDVWHRDIPEFLQIRTNNGDDRMKAHDVFPAVCYPDYFWQQVRDNIDGDWALLSPNEVERVKGYALEDSFGDEWTERYLDCINDSRIKKRMIPLKDLVRLIIKSAVETGTPFAFMRDTVNKANPNKHKGMIYCSNLCTEIAQNMAAVSDVEQYVQEVNGEKVVVNVTKPGDYVVCNLASLNLGALDVTNDAELAEVTRAVVRALDNVIDLNYFPVPYAEINNKNYRPIGLGISGYHHMLALNHISWESDEHLRFVDEVFERINYHTISASAEIAEEKGAYAFFEGSEWETGEYFTQRNYTDVKWTELADRLKKVGLRNGYLLAVAPTSSTSIVAGTTAGVDPIMNRFFYDEKKHGLIPRVAPDLSPETYWYYKNAHLIDQTWSIRASGIRGRHIDQAQSMNLYITNDYSFRQILNLYLLAWEKGVKTIYYIRSKSLEVEECESCSS